MTYINRFDEGRKMIRPGRIEIFIGRINKEAEEFDSPENCPRCKEPMPLLDSYTGPVCSWIHGGCGYIPKSSKFKYEMRTSRKQC